MSKALKMAAPIVLGLAFVVASVAMNPGLSRNPPAAVCDAIRDKAFSECFDAFYDSYYRGGENGKGSEWKEFYDGQRCHQLAENILSVCRDGLNGDAPPSSTTPPTTGQAFCGGIREKALGECADAFYDSYYRRGGNREESDWWLMKNGDRCQNLGRSIYSFLLWVLCTGAQPTVRPTVR
jgi:hypothetical protein